MTFENLLKQIARFVNPAGFVERDVNKLVAMLERSNKR